MLEEALPSDGASRYGGEVSANQMPRRASSDGARRRFGKVLEDLTLALT
jgi:hypothetical protein